MNPAENIEQQIQNLNFQTTPALDARILTDATDRLEQNQTHPAEAHAVTAGFWRHIMKSKLTKLAAAAAVVIAVLMVVYTQSGKIELTTPAFGDVLQQIYKARSVVFKRTIQNGDKEPYVYREMAIEGGLHRTELVFGMIQIWDFPAGKFLQLNTDDKDAFLNTKIGRPIGDEKFSYLDFLQNFENQCEYTGQEELDGKIVNVFMNKNSTNTKTFWVDPETNLPVKVKEVHSASPYARYLRLSGKDFGGDDRHGGAAGGQNEKTIVIYCDFEWNAELDPSLFSMEIPQGYTLRNLEHNVAPPAEEYLAKAMSFCAEMSDGAFPDSIDDLGNVEVIKVMLIEKFNKDGDPQDEMSQALTQWGVIYKGFLFAKEREGLEYQGQGVQLGDADVPICWWNKNDESGKYRVIYGDLRIEDVAPENLPK